jgi:ribosomal protein S3AE
MEIQTSKENILYLMKGSIVTIMAEMSKTEIARFLMQENLQENLLQLTKMEIYPYKQKEVLKWATKIAGYVGKRNAESYGRRNSEVGSVLVKINLRE